MTSARVLLAGNFHWQAGYSQTAAGWVEAADAAGCEVRIAGPLSRMDDEVARRLPVESRLEWGTHLVLLFEARQYLDDTQIEMACTFPRSHRVVVDFDGHWETAHDHVVEGDSTSGRYTVESWRELYSTLSDLVLQPRIGPLPPGAQFFACFAMPETIHHPLEIGADRAFDLQYIGSNWWRWEALTGIVDAARACWSSPRLRVCGRWWDGTTCPGFEDATAGVPNWLVDRGVDVVPPVPFGEVVTEMGRSTLSPVLVRPLVAGSGLLTPRMFETLASGSLPVLPVEAAFLLSVYGDEAAPLLLGADPTETLLRATSDFDRHARIVGSIQKRLRDEYNYPRSLRTLVDILD